MTELYATLYSCQTLNNYCHKKWKPNQLMMLLEDKYITWIGKHKYDWILSKEWSCQPPFRYSDASVMHHFVLPDYHLPVGYSKVSCLNVFYVWRRYYSGTTKQSAHLTSFVELKKKMHRFEISSNSIYPLLHTWTGKTTPYLGWIASFSNETVVNNN